MAAQLDYHHMSAIFARFQAAQPEPQGELVHTNAFTLLVAVVLSAQATDVGVNKATAGLSATANSPAVALLTPTSVACADSTTATRRV